MGQKKKQTPKTRLTEFRRLLKKCRTEQYTYATIADELEISMSTAQNWCKGFTSPSDERVVSLLPTLRKMVA